MGLVDIPIPEERALEYRVSFLGGIFICVVLALALAWPHNLKAAAEPAPNTTLTTTSVIATPVKARVVISATTTSTTLPAVPAANESIDNGDSRTFIIANAGTVVIGRVGNSLGIYQATPNRGWSSVVEEPVGHQVEGVFRTGGLRVDYSFSLAGEVVTVEIRTRETSTATTLPPPPTTTPTTTTEVTQPPVEDTVPPDVTTPPDSVSEEIISAGGSVVVSVSDGELRLDSVSPRPGFEFEIKDDGPDRIVVDFESDDLDYRLRIKLSKDGLDVLVDVDED